MIPLPYQLGIVAVTLIAGIAGGYVWGNNYATEKYTAQAVELERDYTKVLMAAFDENETLKVKLEEDYEKAKLVIADLVDKSADATRVSIPRAKCPTVKPNSTEGSSESDPAARDFYQRLEGILEADRQRTLGIIERAEIELASCGVVKKWASRIALKPAQQV